MMKRENVDEIDECKTKTTIIRIGWILLVGGLFTILVLNSYFDRIVIAADSDGKCRDESLRVVTLTGSRQGQSVGFIDVDGDGIDDMMTGAPYATSSSEIGALLVYKRNAEGGISSCPSIHLTGGDNYGFSFVNLGDVDGDGKEDFAVGAIHGDGPYISLSGNVIVYKGGRDWNYDEGREKVIAKLSGEGPMDKFGFSISAGDLNGDGRKDLIVGAPFNTKDPVVYQGGAVYVYFAPDYTNRVVLPASSQNKGLGLSVAAGNINGDDISDLCISASGKVLCYYGMQDFNPSIDSPDVIIKSSSAGFGKVISLIGDLNGDSLGEIVIGAPNAVVTGNRDTGSVYVVKGGTGKRTIIVDMPSLDLIVRIDGEALFNRFGSSIAAVGDIDGDKKVDLAIGAPMADSDANTLTGKVYLFRGRDINGNITLADSTVFTGFTTDQGYGTSLAAKSGLLLIGAPGTDMGSGAVFMVDLTNSLAVPSSGEYGLSDFSAYGLKLQPAPSGYVPGKNSANSKGTHNAGEECGACHRPNGKAPIVFTASGTLYEDRAGRKPLEGGEVILQDVNGNVISMTSNQVGNFWTFAPISSNPYAVASHGGMTDPLYYYEDGIFHPADPNDSRSWQYKTWVRSGDNVRHMVTIGPLGGATDPNSRMSCNMHHAPMGSRGALWGNGKSTLSSYPRSHLSLKKDILPIFRNKCVPCHIPGETWTRIVTRSDFEGSPLTMIDYSKSLDLTSYNGSNVTVGNITWNKRGIKNVTVGYQKNPDSSPVIGMTIKQQDGRIVHPGGAFWTAEDADYLALRQWISEGAKNN